MPGIELITFADVLQQPGRFYWPRSYYAQQAASATTPWASSAQNFEAKTGIQGVAGRYQLPGPITRDSLMKFQLNESVYLGAARDMARGVPLFSPIPAIHAEGQRVLPHTLRMIDAIAAINPALQALQFDRTNRIAATEVLAGIKYDFNPQDIMYYVHRDNHPAYRNAEWQQWRQAAAAASPIFWHPAPETLETIVRQSPASQKVAEKLGIRVPSPVMDVEPVHGRSSRMGGGVMGAGVSAVVMGGAALVNGSSPAEAAVVGAKAAATQLPGAGGLLALAQHHPDEAAIRNYADAVGLAGMAVGAFVGGVAGSPAPVAGNIAGATALGLAGQMTASMATEEYLRLWARYVRGKTATVGPGFIERTTVNAYHALHEAATQRETHLVYEYSGAELAAILAQVGHPLHHAMTEKFSAEYTDKIQMLRAQNEGELPAHLPQALDSEEAYHLHRFREEIERFGSLAARDTPTGIQRLETSVPSMAGVHVDHVPGDMPSPTTGNRPVQPSAVHGRQS